MGTEVIRHAATRGGRPTLYRPELPEEILTYFFSTAQTTLAVVAQTTDAEFDGTREENGNPVMVKGRKREEVRRICGQVPTFQRFAGSVGVTCLTLTRWRKLYPEFDEAYVRCQEVQEDWFIQGLATGAIPSQGGIFAAGNITRFVDRAENRLTVAEVPTEKPALANCTQSNSKRSGR
ncbi:MAG: hypothetical protein QOJ99_6071 [Bryobacterales bacterium]|jgi:hypothetical protein|nr:hypothetical protein [Bryobacterales bacterium]